MLENKENPLDFNSAELISRYIVDKIIQFALYREYVYSIDRLAPGLCLNTIKEMQERLLQIENLQIEEDALDQQSPAVPQPFISQKDSHGSSFLKVESYNRTYIIEENQHESRCFNSPDINNTHKTDFIRDLQIEDFKIDNKALPINRQEHSTPKLRILHEELNNEIIQKENSSITKLREAIINNRNRKIQWEKVKMDRKLIDKKCFVLSRKEFNGNRMTLDSDGNIINIKSSPHNVDRLIEMKSPDIRIQDGSLIRDQRTNGYIKMQLNKLDSSLVKSRNTNKSRQLTKFISGDNSE